MKKLGITKSGAAGFQRKSPFFRFIAGLVLLTFSTQITWAQGSVSLESLEPKLPETGITNPEASSPNPEIPFVETSTEFLKDDSPLKTVGAAPRGRPSEQPQGVIALDLLRPEFTSAVILEKPLSLEDLEGLRNHSIQEGIEIAGVILHGQTVLITTGSGDEITASPAARKILKKVTFAFHTHPDEHSKGGPTYTDLLAAGEDVHYVVARDKAYAYNETGVLEEGNLNWLYEQYIETIRDSLQESDHDEIKAREELNLLIAEQDKLNEIPKEEREAWLRGGTFSYTSGLTSSSVTALPGNPSPNLMPGSSPTTTFSVGTDGRFQLSYNVSLTGSYSGMTLSFDDPSTASVETQNLSTFENLIFGLQGNATALKVEFIDLNGNKDSFTLTNLSFSTELFWKMATSALVSTVDKTKIKQISLFVDPSTTPSTNRTGTVSVRVKGVHLSAPPAGVSFLSDNFNRTSLGNDWTVVRGNYKISSNSLYGFNSYPISDGGVVLNKALGSNDYDLQVSTYYVNGGGVTPRGFLARYQDLNNYYYVKVSRFGAVTLLKKQNGVLSTIAKAAVSVNQNAWNIERLIVQGNTFKFYFNGTLALQAQDLTNPLTTGKVGLYADLYYEKLDDFSVTTLGSTSPPGPPAVNALPTYTNTSTLTLSGTKPPNTSIWINGASALPLDSLTTWSYAAPLLEGLNSFQVTAKDGQGNASTSTSASTTRDTLVPTGSVKINDDAAYAISQTVTLDLTASDSLSGIDQMRFSTDGGQTWSDWETFATTKSFTLPSGDGTKEVQYQVKDKAGNTITSSDTVILDTAPPQVQVLSTNQVDIPTYEFVYQVDGVQKTQFRVLTEGANTFTISESDAAGNTTNLNYSVNYVVSPVNYFHFTREAESIQKSTGGLDAMGTAWIIWANGEVYDSVSLTEPGIYEIQVVARGETALDGIWPLMEARVDNAAIAPAVSVDPNNGKMKTYSFKNIELLTGNKKFSVAFTNDYYGSAGDDRNLYVDQFIVKKTVAYQEVINGGVSYVNTPDVALNLNGLVTNPSQMRFSTDGRVTWTNWEAYQDTKPLTLPLGDGTKQVWFEVKDQTGLVYDFADKITLDTTPPEIIFTSVALTNNATYTLTYTVDGVATSRSEILAEGDNTLSVTATDPAGNSTTATHSVTLDTTPPVINNVASNNITTSGVTLAWNTNEASDSQVEYRIQGTATWSATAINSSLVTTHSVTLTGLSAGTTYEYQVKSRDQAGNLATQPAISTLTTQALPPATITEPGLIGYWNFEGGTAQDQSGNGNNGTLGGGVTQSPDHPDVQFTNTGSLGFDGVDDYVKAPLVTSKVNNISMAFWARVKASSDERGALIFNGSGLNGYGLFAGSRDGGSQNTFQFLAQYKYWHNTGVSWTPDQWHHLVVTLEPNGSGTVWRLYKDGVLVYTSGVLGNPSTPTLNTMIGAEGPGGPSVASGIDDVRIYNRVLTAQEVEVLAQGKIPTPDTVVPAADVYEPGLSGYWDFEAAGETSAADRTGSGNNGTLVNGPTLSPDHPSVQFPDSGSLAFDGVNDYVELGGSPSLSSARYALSFWVNVGASLATDGRILSRRSATDWSQTNYLVTIAGDTSANAGKIDIVHVRADNVKHKAITTTDFRGAGWKHVLALYDGANLALYVNGVLESKVASGSPDTSGTQTLRIGRSQHSTETGFFKGSLDDIRIYNRALTLSEIQTLAAGNTLDSTPPTGSISINGNAAYTTSTNVTVNLTASDAGYGIDQMRFSVDEGQTWTDWEAVTPTKNLTLPEKGGLKEVRCELQDKAGNRAVFSDTITYNPVLIDGTQLFYEGSSLARELTPDGHEVFFRQDGSLERFRYSTGEEIRYSEPGPHSVQIHAGDGTLLETIDNPKPQAFDQAQTLRVTMDGGVEAFYVAGVLKELRTSTGIRVANFTRNAANEIQDALIVYPDGTREVVRRGVLLRRISPDGTILDFTPKGFAVREIAKTGLQFYDFTKVSQTQVSQTRIFTPAGDSSVYDEKGILREVKGADGKHFIYSREADGTEWITHLDLASSGTPGSQTLVEAHYTASGSLTQMKMNDGTEVFIEGGTVKRVLAPDGKETTYSYLEDQGFLQGLTVNRDTTAFSYDSKGFLSQVKTASGTLTRQAQDTNGNGLLTDEEVIDLLLETTGGDRLTDFELDSEGRIIKGVIETKEGIKQRIENGVLTGFETVDGRVYDFQGQEALLREWKFRDGTRVIFGGASISEILFPDGKRLHTIGFNMNKEIESFTEESQDGTKRIFQNNKLVTLITPTGAQIHYGDSGLAEEIQLPDASKEKISYEKDDQGNLIAVAFEGQNTKRVYSPDGTLMRLLTKGVNAEVAAGEVSRLFTRFGNVQAPQFDPNGILSGEIVFTDGTKQRIENGKLAQTIRPTGTRVSYADGKIDLIETASGIYRVLPDTMKLRLESVQGSPEVPLVPYLLRSGLPEDTSSFDTFVHPVTANGNAKISTSQSKSGGSSAYFDNNNSYLSIPDSEDWDFGGGDFTIDFWLNFNFITDGYIFDQGERTLALWMNRTASGNKLTVTIAGEDVISYVWPYAIGDWHHIGVVRSQGSVKLFVDGAAVAQSANTKDIQDSTPFYIGSYRAYGIDGWLDEFRITKGLARWTSNFTPPPSEYTKDVDTKLLLHANGLDGSANFQDAPLERLGLLKIIQDHPPEAELREILLPRPLYDSLGERFKIESQMSTGDSVFFANLAPDQERGSVYEFGANYFPEWTNVSLTPEILNQGFISKSETMDLPDHLPALSSDLIDMNGDGLKDRVYIDPLPNVGYWWIQYNMGQGFQAPVKWTGVNQRFDEYAATWYTYGMGALRYYEGRHPDILADLVDLNGDGRPDRVLQKLDGSPEWYVQINNSSGFDPITVWGGKAHPLSQPSAQATYASEVRYEGPPGESKPVQELIADLVDLDGDGLPDRVLRPYVAPFDHWFFQKNLGNGFADAVLWNGVDTSFDTDTRMAASLNWYAEAGGQVGDISDLIDMNGDKRPDRLLLKNKDPNNPDSPLDWYIQFNNDSAAVPEGGNGFDAAVLWDSDVRVLPGDSSPKIGSALRVFTNPTTTRHYLVDLRDVTGDGLPDRISLDRYDSAAVPEGGVTNTPQTTWWVEVNTGSGFANAVAWTGIDGANGVETSIGQDDSHFRSLPAPSYGHEPGTVWQVTDLTDINGDKILDRVIYSKGKLQWLVQLGTGHGFLPASEMKIEGLNVATSTVRSSRYDFLHVSLKGETEILASTGKVKVVLSHCEERSDEATSGIASDTACPRNDDQVIQEWSIENISTSWQDFYLPIDRTKANANQVQIKFEPVDSLITTPLYVDNVTFVATRPPAVKDWLDRMLAEENVLTDIHSERTQTLAQYLGLIVGAGASARPNSGDHGGSPLPGVDFSRLLTAETKIQFDAATSEATQFTTFYGSVSKIENGQVSETTLPNGTRIQFDTTEGVTQTVTRPDGTAETNTLSYGRVRTVTRPTGNPLEYSYEFNSNGTEITVVHDPDSGITERYLENRIILRTLANGVTHQFEYNGKGELARTLISYKGRVRAAFEHSTTSEGLRAVRTEAGVLEEYSAAVPEGGSAAVPEGGSAAVPEGGDSAGKIKFHTTPEGYRYAHTFERVKRVVATMVPKTVTYADGSTQTFQVPTVTLEDDPAGEEVHRVTLASYRAPSGEYAEYGGTVQGGEGDAELKSLKLADETRVSYDRIKITESTDPETGELTRPVKLLDATVFHPDGTVTEFRDGSPYSVASATGRVISIATEDSLLVNPSESAAFLLAEAQKLWADIVHKKWTDYQAPPTLPIKIEYDKTSGALVTREFAEGVIELYENDKISQVLARDGEKLIEYSYDPEGNPTQIHMSGARRRLESAVLKLKAEVAVEREKALAKVADREAVLNQTIEGQYVTARDRLFAIRAQIEAERSKVASIKVKGKQAKGLIAGAVSQIDAGIDQVNGALEQLARQRAEALAQLAQQVQETNTQIETETQNAYTQIETENGKARDSILRQEISPVVFHWYRKILGRDPNQGEYDAVMGIVDYNCQAAGQTSCVAWLQSLKTTLNNSPELASRTAEVEAIKDRVQNELLNYLTLSSSGQVAYAQSLGIAAEDRVALTSSEATAILDWLRTRSLHFGQSAYLVLETLLNDAGIAHTRVELASKLILIDILTGTLTPLEGENLVISVYALRRLAQTYGLTTTAYKMTYEALKAMYDNACVSSASACPFRFIVHINGDHFVIVTKVTDTEVTYIDPGAGPDDLLQQMTLTREEFLEAWGLSPQGTVPGVNGPSPSNEWGYVLSTRAPPSTLPSTQVSSLTTQEEQSVRGAFFFFLIPIIMAIVSAIAQAVAAIIATIVGIIGAIVSTIGQILVSIGSFFQGFFGAIFEGLKAGFGAVLKGLGAFGKGLLSVGKGFVHAFNSLHGALLGGIQGIADSLPFVGPALSSLVGTSTFSNSLALGMIGFGLLGTGVLLEKIGLSPKIAQSIISGGKIAIGVGLLAAGNPLGITTSLGLAGSGTSELLNLHTNLSPTISNIIGIGTSALGAFAVGGINTSTLSGALAGLKTSLPYLSMDLASSGLTAIGSRLGLDWRLSLISIPVRAAVGGSTTMCIVAPCNLSGNGGLGGILQAIRDGLAQAAKSIGFDFGGASSHPLFGSLSSGAILQSIESSLGRAGLFSNLFDVLKQALLSPFNLVNGVVRTVLDGFSSFNSEIETRGLAGALESFATSIFSRETLEKVLNWGGISNLLGSASKVLTTLVTGEQAQEIKIDSATSIFFDLLGNFIGKREGGMTQVGTFGLDRFGKWGLVAGKVIASIMGDLVFAGEAKDGQLSNLSISGANGVIIEGNSGSNAPIIIDGSDSSSGEFWNMIFKLVPLGISLFFKEGIAKAADIAVSAASSVSNALTDIVLLNGFSLIWKFPIGTIPEYFESGNPFRDKLNDLGISDSAIKAIALFEESRLDFFEWFLNLKLSFEIQQEFTRIRKTQPDKPFVPLAYSGAGRPLLDALANKIQNGFDVKTAILVGTPLTFEDTIIRSPSLERIINVFGSDDPFYRLQDLPSIPTIFTHESRSIETINIQLLDIHHTEYFYANGEITSPEQVKASNFIAWLTQASLSDAALTKFLELLGTPTTQRYIDPITSIEHMIHTYILDTKNLPDNF